MKSQIANSAPKLVTPARFSSELRSLRRRGKIVAAVLVVASLVCLAAWVDDLSPSRVWANPLDRTSIIAMFALVLCGGGLVPAGAVFWLFRRAPRKGLFLSIGKSWIVTTSTEGLVLQHDEVATRITWTDVSSAEWVMWDEAERVKGLEDVVWLHLVDGVTVPVPMSAANFDDFRDRAQSLVPFTRRDVTL